MDEIESPLHQSYAGVYVCSFSKNANQLSQWRGYCPSGSGFSIGFDFNSSLEGIVESEGFNLVECIYDKNEQSDIVESFLESTLDNFRKNDDYSPKGLAIRDFLTLAPRLKHPKFEEEQEWRLISSSKLLTDVKFRAGKSMLVPYVKVSLFEFQDEIDKNNKKKTLTCIPEIWIGPTPDPYLSSISLENFLRSERIFRVINDKGWPVQKCLVFASDIPYRTW